MEPSQLRNQVAARPALQVVGVPQDHMTVQILQLLIGHPLDCPCVHVGHPLALILCSKCVWTFGMVANGLR